MGEIINLNEFRSHAAAPCAELSLESETDTKRIEAVRDHIEHTLEDITREEDLPLTVAMSAAALPLCVCFNCKAGPKRWHLSTSASPRLNYVTIWFVS